MSCTSKLSSLLLTYHTEYNQAITVDVEHTSNHGPQLFTNEWDRAYFAALDLTTTCQLLDAAEESGLSDLVDKCILHIGHVLRSSYQHNIEEFSHQLQQLNRI
jgi:hypothetical protein